MLPDGREQLGSGYLVSGRLVLTAEHCIRDKVTGEPAAGFRVVRASDGAMADVVGVVPDRGLDVAVLKLADNAPWDADLPPTVFARVDQSHSGTLKDCTGIGFPLFQRDPARRTRHTSEFHGTVYQTDERESGRLLMREPLIRPGPVANPEGETLSGRGQEGPSPWGGLSGTVMFYRGCAIGVVVEHHPRQGDSALHAIGFEQIAASTAIGQCLGLSGPDSLPWVSEQAAARVLLAGWPLTEVRDPFVLEVHRPVQPEDPQPGMPVLPAYVPRDHDTALGSVVQAAAEGRSGIAVLVGGSSTGKTRACWEALQLLDRPGPWRLWHPIDPSRPEAVLRELPAIGPRTVVWLNEAQFYLDPAETGLGERVAAGLRELLRDPGRAPVLVLATLWPQFWDMLTARSAGNAPDPHAQARELLAGHDITVPATFTPAQLQQLREAGDARLAQAAAGAQDGQVIQFLAGAPELLARYRNAPPAAAALIDAAMDARRLGMGAGLPGAFLEAAAPGYLTDDQWDAMGKDWLEQALAYTAKDAKGVRGPLTRIRPRPARHAARTRGDQPGGAAAAAGPLYRLADYLDQYGRADRAGRIPPAEFWSAAVHAALGDQAALGAAAHARGLYRDAAQLHKNAAASGDPRAVIYLSHPPACLSSDPRPAHWAVAHASLDDNPNMAAVLLDSLREAGAHEQAAALAGRAVAHAPLDDPGAVAWLLDSLGEAGAHEQAAALAGRAVAHAPLDDPGDVSRLLGSLGRAGFHEQAAALLARDPAAHVALDGLGDVTSLLERLERMLRADADEQAAALAGRAAAHAPLDDTLGVSLLLHSLRNGDAPEQAAALLHRDPAAHVALNNPRDVAWLLDSLRRADAHEQAAALAGRAAAHAPLDDPRAVAKLLDSLRKAGTPEQAAALADRAAAHAPLDNPGAVARLLDSLRRADAHDQVAALAGRAAAHASLDDAYGVAWLLDSLRDADAYEQLTALADRAAAHAPLDNPDDVALLLDRLREAGFHEQAAALLHRDPAAHVALDGPVGVAGWPGPGGVAGLLDSLREAGADEQAAALLARDPAAHAALDNPRAVAGLLDRLREAGADEQAAALAGRAAAHAPLDNPRRVADLLDRLRAAGFHEQAAALASRLPGAGMFELFREQADRQDQFRFGREAGGSPAKAWGWGDLD